MKVRLERTCFAFFGPIDREAKLSLDGEQAEGVGIHHLIETGRKENLVFRHVLLLGPSRAQRARGPSSPGRTGSAPVASGHREDERVEPPARRKTRSRAVMDQWED